MELNNFQKIDIDLINEKSYSISYDDEKIINTLEYSLKKYGQIQSLVVMKRKDSYYIVDGYKRYKIMKQLGYREVFAYVLDNLSRIDFYLLNIILKIELKSDMIKFCKRIKDILEVYDSTELSMILPYEKTEIEKYPKLLEFDFRRYDDDLHNKVYSEKDETYF